MTCLIVHQSSTPLPVVEYLPVPCMPKTHADMHLQGLEILRASLQSKTVLTDVFLGKNNLKPTTMSNGRGTNTTFCNGTRPQSLAWRA